MNKRPVPQVLSVMTPFPHSVEVDAPIHQARVFMREHGIRHLPVTNNDELVGVVTDRDIKLLLGPDFDYPQERELTVKDAYMDHAYVVDVSEPLDEVLFQMSNRHIGSALVTKHNKLVGIFTTSDACKSYGELLRSKHPNSGGDEAA